MTRNTYTDWSDEQLEDARVAAGEAYQEAETLIGATLALVAADALSDEQAARAYRKGMDDHGYGDPAIDYGF